MLLLGDLSAAQWLVRWHLCPHRSHGQDTPGISKRISMEKGGNQHFECVGMARRGSRPTDSIYGKLSCVPINSIINLLESYVSAQIPTLRGWSPHRERASFCSDAGTCRLELSAKVGKEGAKLSNLPQVEGLRTIEASREFR